MSRDESKPAAVGREALAGLLAEEIEECLTLLREAMTQKKPVRQRQVCPKCKHIYRGEYRVRDLSLALKALELILDRVEGRASMAQGDGGGEEFVFINQIIEGCLSCPCESCQMSRIVKETRSESRTGWEAEKVERLASELKEQNDG